MQPETKEKIKAINDTFAPKEPKKLEPINEWDQLAFALIYQELAPKGFKKIYNGKKEVSAIQFLTKQTVKRCQNISAQLIRAYRQALRKHLESKVKESNEALMRYQVELSDCGILNFKAKARCKKSITHYAALIGAYESVRIHLDMVEIPRKK